MIKWKLNQNGYAWAEENERQLCSKYEPTKEAQLWVNAQNFSGKEKQICVVGLGALYHIFELRDRFKDVELILISSGEIDLFNAPTAMQIEWQNLLQSKAWYFSNMSLDRIAELCVIQDFSPAVVLFRAACDFTEIQIYEKLRGLHKGTLLQNNALESKVDKANMCKLLTGVGEKDLINIKSLSTQSAQTNDNEFSKEEKAYLVLKELIR